MAKTKTVRIYATDRERINEIAEMKGEKPADVVAELLRDPLYRCPECGEVFDPCEVDPSTVREHGLFSCGMEKLVRGEREVKDFACPVCGEQISPVDIEQVDADEWSGATADDVGVTGENADGELSSEEV